MPPSVLDSLIVEMAHCNVHIKVAIPPMSPLMGPIRLPLIDQPGRYIRKKYASFSGRDTPRKILSVEYSVEYYILGGWKYIYIMGIFYCTT